MFWRFGFHTASSIDSILEKETFTLEELLDEDEIIQEIRSHNKKLVDYFSRKENISALIDYIITAPPPGADDKLKTKYPFVASEILSGEIWAICETLVNNPDILDKLLAYLDTDSKLNVRMASYFTKVVTMLLNKRLSEMVEFIKKNKPKFVDRVVHHVGTTAIMELLLKIIAAEDNLLDTEAESFVEWLAGTKMAPQLIDRLAPTLDSDIHENAGQSLVDLISVASNRNPDHIILVQLRSKDVVNRLLDHTLSGVISSQTHGINVLIELLSRQINQNYDSSTQTSPASLPELCQCIYPKLTAFHALLANPPNIRVRTSTGAIEPPLGQGRLKVLEFFVAIVRSQWHPFNLEIIKLNTLGLCFDLFFQYKWNNFLHNLVVLMVTTILEGASEELFMTLFDSVKVIDRILAIVKEAEGDQPPSTLGTKGTPQVRGYMGHIIRLSNELVRAAESNDKLDSMLKDNLPWNTYTDTKLLEFNRIENTALGGASRTGWLEDSDDEDLFDGASIPEMIGGKSDLEAFTRYLVEQNASSDTASVDSSASEAEAAETVKKIANTTGSLDDDDGDEKKEEDKPPVPSPPSSVTGK